MRKALVAGLAGYVLGVGLCCYAVVKDPPVAAPEVVRYQEINRILEEDFAGFAGLEAKARRVGIDLTGRRKKLEEEQNKMQRRIGFAGERVVYEIRLAYHQRMQINLFLAGVGVLAAVQLGLWWGLREQPKIYPEFHVAGEKRLWIYRGHHS